jgi:hypothetical protein
MMWVNHSCEPNAGMGGNVLLVSMRDIAAGEEITLDYALFLTDPGFAMECHCGAVACRGIVTGTDWMRADLRERYRVNRAAGSPVAASTSASATSRCAPQRASGSGATAG